MNLHGIKLLIDGVIRLEIFDNLSHQRSIGESEQLRILGQKNGKNKVSLQSPTGKLREDRGGCLSRSKLGDFRKKDNIVLPLAPRNLLIMPTCH